MVHQRVKMSLKLDRKMVQMLKEVKNLSLIQYYARETHEYLLGIYTNRSKKVSGDPENHVRVLKDDADNKKGGSRRIVDHNIHCFEIVKRNCDIRHSPKGSIDLCLKLVFHKKLNVGIHT